MKTIQYYNGKEWVFVSEWKSPIGWLSLGDDTWNLRMIDENENVIFKGHNYENIPL